jgi:hypothetical protein
MGLLKESDSVFSILINKNPQMKAGYLWRARTRVRIDSMDMESLAKPDMEKLLNLNQTDRSW